ncbi:MAG: ABC transporter permease subunit [Candidatus Bathyarchaeia archaeon]|jgi:ABC-type Na+ efflux pump permease subunit
MDLQSAWAVAAKDFKIFKRKTMVIYITVVFPLVVGIAFPLIVQYALHIGSGHGMTALTLPRFMDAFSIWFLIGSAIIPTTIASYSLVGEKIQKSLEPLLATPMTDGEILLGKTISGLVVPLGAIYAGSVIYMSLMDLVTHSTLGYLYYPNWHIGAILLVAPLICLLSVELNIIISSRVNDVRTAQQMGMLAALPFFGVYITSEIGVFAFNDTNLLILAGVILVIAVVVFFVSRITFQREEILTKWK